MAKRHQSSRKSAEQAAPTAPGKALIETESEPATNTEQPGSSAVGLWRRVIYPLVPVLIALLASVNSLWNYFASDDLEQVLNNPFIKKLGNLPAAFTTSVWSFTSADIVFTVDSYFRPIFSILFGLNYAMFGTKPWGWHLVNILIHATVTLLVYAVARELTARNWVSALTASLFAVHPAHAESVAWVSGITDPLMMLPLLPSFYFYLRYRRQGAKYLLGCALVFFLVALLCKETAVALPVIVAYCELYYFKVDESFRQRAVRALKLLALFAIPTAVYVAMRYNALGALLLSGNPRYPVIPSLLTIPLAIVKYLKLMFIPWGYSYQHNTDFVESAGSISFLGPLALVIAVVVGVLRLKSRELKLGAIWFTAMLMPSLAAVRQFEPAYLVQDRYLYAPSVGICLAIALGFEWIATRDRSGSRARLVANTAAVLLVIVWGAVLISQNRVWDDTLSMSRNNVAVSPRTPITHVSLSRAYYDAGWPHKAEAEARTALDLDPRCAPAYLNLSYYARLSGKLDAACEYLERGIAVVPETPITRHDLATMYLNLGLLYGQRKMFDVGEQNLLRSIEISPRPVAWYYTGQFYTEQGRFENARTMYEQTLEQAPHWFANIHLRLGLTYEALGDMSRALAEYEKFLELAPADSPDREGVAKHLTSMKGGGSSK